MTDQNEAMQRMNAARTEATKKRSAYDAAVKVVTEIAVLQGMNGELMAHARAAVAKAADEHAVAQAYDELLRQELRNEEQLGRIKKQLSLD